MFQNRNPLNFILAVQNILPNLFPVKVIRNKFSIRFSYIFFSLLLLFPAWSKSQDTANLVLDSAKVYSFSSDFEQQEIYFLSSIDTLITNVQKYDPQSEDGKYYATCGNPGLASQNMLFSPRIKSGYTFGVNSYDPYLFLQDSIKYYWVGRPYTHLFYIMGAKKQQNLHIDHSQNISSWFTLGLRFRYVSSPGFYKRQQSDDKNFVLKTRFQTRNYRYMVLANYIHNKVQVEENGGILYDSVFEENSKPDRQGMITNLGTANNQIKENAIFIKQYFKIANRDRFDVDDSTNNSFIDRINPGNLSHSFRLSNLSYLYTQDKSDNNGFYSLTVDSVNGTYDSTRVYQIENQFSWTNADNAKDQLLTFNFSLRHLYSENEIDSVKAIFNQLVPNGMMDMSFSDRLRLRVYGDLVLGNTYGGDFNLKADLSVKTKYGKLAYTLHNANQAAGQFYQFYKSNHFKWNNTFKKQYFLINQFSYDYKSFRVSANLLAIENFVYMNTLAEPDQLDKNIQVLQFQVRKLFKLGNWSLNARVNYQKASTLEAIRIPELAGDASIYYTNDLFKEAAILQTGFDLFYNTSYYAYSYMPATRSFYIQNERQVGEYLYANAFLNLQISRARLFVKYHNLGFLAGDYRYYTVPGYPMQDGGFRFGISWMFYD